MQQPFLCAWKNSKSWCGATHVSVMMRAASAGPQRLSVKRFNPGKTPQRPVPNTVLNCLIGIASSKTILNEQLTVSSSLKDFGAADHCQQSVGDARTLFARPRMKLGVSANPAVDPSTPRQARFLAKDTRWLKMDDGKDRLPDTQITVNNNVLNLAMTIAVAGLRSCSGKC